MATEGRLLSMIAYASSKMPPANAQINVQRSTGLDVLLMQ